MLNCIIIDDEPNAISVLQEYIGKTKSLNLRHTFRNPLEAINYLKKEAIDLIFLDINMPLMNGIEFSESLVTKPLIVFTTAYSEYAVKSYDLNAVDYLMKPIRYNRFLKAIDKAVKIFNSAHTKVPGYIDLKSGSQLYHIHIADICFLEKDKHYIIIHFLKKQLVIRMTFNSFLDTVPGDYFIQVHKSFVISLQHLQRVDRNYAIVSGKNIPIGRRYRDYLLNSLKS